MITEQTCQELVARASMRTAFLQGALTEVPNLRDMDVITARSEHNVERTFGLSSLKYAGIL